MKTAVPQRIKMNGVKTHPAYFKTVSPSNTGITVNMPIAKARILRWPRARNVRTRMPDVTSRAPVVPSKNANEYYAQSDNYNYSAHGGK
jgi:hypothetical protein